MRGIAPLIAIFLIAAVAGTTVAVTSANEISELVEKTNYDSNTKNRGIIDDIETALDNIQGIDSLDAPVKGIVIHCQDLPIHASFYRGNPTQVRMYQNDVSLPHCYIDNCRALHYKMNNAVSANDLADYALGHSSCEGITKGTIRQYLEYKLNN